MDLLVVRHGEVAAQYQGRFLSSTDAPLSEQGSQQVGTLASALTRLKPSRIVSSPLGRAVGTASTLSDSLNCKVEIEPALREMNMGRLEGEHPEDLLRLDELFYRQWRSDMGRARFPDGESLADVAARLEPWIESLRTSTDDVVVAVTHLYVILALVHHLTRVPSSRLRHVYIDTGSVTHWTLGTHTTEDRLRRLNWRPDAFSSSLSLH